MNLHLLFLAALPLGWLVPNHYHPWPAAWGDSLVLMLLGLAWLTQPRLVRIPRLWLFVCGLCAAVAMAQWALGQLSYGGDALMVALYVAALLMGIVIGRSWSDDGRPESLDTPLATLCVAIAMAAIASVGVALLQWTGAFSMGIWGVDMRAGGRPFGNLAQPNHLCSVAFLGLCAVAWLHERRRIGAKGATLAALWLIFGMVMSGSRTGWLQLGLALALVLWMYRRANLRLWPGAAAGLATAFVAMVALWPAMNSGLQLAGGRSVTDIASASFRKQHWTALVDAVIREPLWGYGWQQVPLAQQKVALFHPPVGEHIEHAHNIVLDLLLWNGLPIGLLLTSLIGWWLLRHTLACCSGTSTWLLAAVGGLVIHGLLEFPLEYAYFLVPLGLLLGALSARARQDSSLAMPRPAVLTVGVGFIVLLVLVGRDYFQAEENYRSLRMETARIGTDRLITPASNLLVLTQLEALLRFAREEARPGMAPAEIDSMRRVAERYGYPPVMLRYALAAGLNSEPDAARDTLGRLCRIHPAARCHEARESWQGMLEKYPQLSAVPLPDMPPASK